MITSVASIIRHEMWVRIQIPSTIEKQSITNDTMPPLMSWLAV